ncbi:McrB family protein [Fuchsiella alkaliacetigena]|uniref:McrB family protein n=1 Tax=Fuchsiella alkaliacetigena TaxID=957042 RepID=UPI00200B751C|nr:AAA family ATPase [Fuchsiella alkaliacetigena]MCK8825246.1 AAA family ATPase [Fuchsiella alkaliacetigena]
MEDLSFLISKFEEKFDDSLFIEKDKLRKEFVDKFPLEEIKDLSIEQYALGLENKEESLSWWIEYNTNELGSIKGGNAGKHKVYFSPKYNKWIYPEEFSDQNEAWQQLRQEIYDFLIKFKNGEYQPVDDSKIISGMKAARSKLLYMYFPDRVLPMFKLEDIREVLRYFDYQEEDYRNFDITQANLELKKVMDNKEEFKGWNGQKFMRFVYTMILDDYDHYKIAPGDDAKYWEDCLENNYICIGWDKIGDLNNFVDYNEFKYKFQEIYEYDKSKATEKANEVWTFFSLQPGDIVIANKGTNEVVGIGEVTDKGYSYNEDRKEYKHTVGVEWKEDFEAKTISKQNYWAFKTVYEVSEDLYKEIVEEDQNNNEVTNKVIVKTFTNNEKKLFNRIDKNLHRKGNIILYGPPGTGKTYMTMRYLEWKEEDSDFKNQVEFCTFHPSFAYEDFIEGYKPYSEGGQPVFKLQDGIFKSLCKRAVEANNKDENFYLIIDEINRGDVPKIFGEMITLIEKDKRGMGLILSQSKEEFYVPDNVYIIATMNTSDKSIKMMDAALKRRFAFIECMPNYELIGEEIEKLGLSPKDILIQLNKSLRRIEDREKQIGHAYFMKEDRQIETITELKEVYIYEIIPLISEYCFNDYRKMAEIIGEEFVDEESEELKDELINGVEDYFADVILKKFGGENV